MIWITIIISHFINYFYVSITYIIQIIGFEVVEYNKFYLAISDRIPSAGNRLDSIHILHDDRNTAIYDKNKMFFKTRIFLC